MEIDMHVVIISIEDDYPNDMEQFSKKFPSSCTQLDDYPTDRSSHCSVMRPSRINAKQEKERKLLDWYCKKWKNVFQRRSNPSGQIQELKVTYRTSSGMHHRSFPKIIQS